MKRSSLFKILVFSLALYANLNYLIFLLNPAHVGNPVYFVLDFIADLISIVVLSFNWLSCLHFEFFKGRYYAEIKETQKEGRELIKEKTSVFIPVVNEEISLVRKTLEAATKIKG